MYSTGKRSMIAMAAMLFAITQIGIVTAATSITVQGRLEQSGVAVNAVVDMQLALFDAATGGMQIGTTQTTLNVQVASGLFTIAVDFGASAFDGAPRWLEIAVANPAGSAYATLAPRQEVTAAPYSTHSLKPWESAAGRTWYAGGNVGIGLANPATPLSLLVNGGTRPVGLTQNQIGGDTLEMTSTDGANQQATRLALRGGTNNARVEFYRGPRGSETETMRINAAGDIGIGLTDPLDSLGYSGGWKGLHIAERATSQNGMMCIEGANRSRLHLRNNAGATNRKDFAITNDGQVDFSWLDANLGTRLTVMNCDDQGNVAIGSATGEGKFSITNTSDAVALEVQGSWYAVDVHAGETGVAGRTTTSTGTGVHGVAAGTGGRAVHGYWDDTGPSATGFAGHFTGNAFFSTLGIGRTQVTNALEVEGQASKPTQGSWLQNSDARIKTNVQTISNALDTLERVRLVDYEYTDSYRSAHPQVPDRRYMGVIAQEFAGVFPEYVQPGSDTLPNGDAILQVDTYPLEVYTAAAVQQLHQEVRRREDENSRLRERAKGLIERVSKLEETHCATR